MKSKKNYLNITEVLIGSVIGVLIAIVMTVSLCYMGEYRHGAADHSISGLEVAMSSGEVSEADVWAMAAEDAFSSEGLQQFLRDGYLRGYMDQMKAAGMIPQDFSVGGSSGGSFGGSSGNASSGSGSGKATSSGSSQKKAHTHSYESTVTKQPTCTEEGETTYTCSCGKTYTEAIPATGHNYQVTDSKEVSCEEDGYTTYVCANCGDTYSDMVTHPGHTYEITGEKEATCTEKGYTEYTCSVCGDTYKDEKAELGHKKGEWKESRKPGIFSKGETKLYCSVCGEVLKTESLAPKCPVPLWQIVTGAVVVIAAIAVAVVCILKKKGKIGEKADNDSSKKE